MKDYYHGCTGGCFESPIPWSDIYWSDSDSESVQNYQWIREPSDQYWVIPQAGKKIESDVSCFSCLFGILYIFRF